MLDAAQRITPTSGEDFTATIDGCTYGKRADAVAGLSEWVRTNTPEYGNYNYQRKDYGTVAVLGGHELQARNAGNDSCLGSYQDLAVTIKDVSAPPLVLSRLELLEGSIGVITRLENKVAGLPDYAAQLQHTITEKNAVLADVDAQLGKPFKHEERLQEARAKCTDIEEKLKASIEPPRPVQKEPSATETTPAETPATRQTPGPEQQTRPSQAARDAAEEARLLLKELTELQNIQDQDHPAHEPFPADPVNIRGPRL